MITAKLPVKPVQNGRNYSGDKETISTWTVVAYWRGVMVPVVTARAYMGRSRSASAVYASVWASMGPRLSDDKQRVYFENSTAGAGSAGGYGYHKESAAIAQAIAAAGVELYGSPYPVERYDHNAKRARTPEEIQALEAEAAKRRADIGGVGDSAVEAALLAIAAAVMGKRTKLLLVRG